MLNKIPVFVELIESSGSMTLNVRLISADMIFTVMRMRKTKELKVPHFDGMFENMCLLSETNPKSKVNYMTH